MAGATALAASLVLCALAACSGEETCPPGIVFDDCVPSTAPTRAPVLPAPDAPESDQTASSTDPDVDSEPEPVGGSDAESGVGDGTPLAPVDDSDADPDPPLAPQGDECPDDFSKVAAGACGCGVPDQDLDGDGAMDCNESCPDNAGRTEPEGACGCSALADAAGCNALRDALRHLYTFDGDGVQILDSTGGMNGTLLDANGATSADALAELQVNGRLNLDGFGSFVELPAGMISSLGSATFETWMAWQSGAAWTRVFDFGNNDGGAPTLGQTYLFLTPLNGANNAVRVAYSLAGGGAAETIADATGPMSQGGNVVDHVAVVINQQAGSMQLYLNGSLHSSVPFAGQLSQLNDQNNWLGRSNYSVDPALFGSLIEFRIYDQALTAGQVATSFEAGPGALK